MTHVRVTNGTDEAIVGRYAGQDYEFLPGEPNDVPMIVAQHVFGFGNGDKLTALSRLGWLTTSDRMKESFARLNKVKMENVVMVGKVVDDEDEDDVPVETEKMVPQIAPVSPNTSGGGSEAGGDAPADEPAEGTDFDVP